MLIHVSRGCLLLALAALAPLAQPASAVEIEWVLVGDPGNPPGANCYGENCGSVPYEYLIGRYEVTNAEYAEFLDAKAASDPLGLYNGEMGSSEHGGITRSGADGSYLYTVKLGFESKPVNFVSFWDAVRFANWVHNGQADGDTETGAYTLTPEGIADNAILRNPGAIVFLPNENEWFKAAFYDASTTTYWFYPTDPADHACTAPTATAGRSNCNQAAAGPTAVGAYTGSPSPYGTFDQGGNVWEWSDGLTLFQPPGGQPAIWLRISRGGGWRSNGGFLGRLSRGSGDPTGETDGQGFRLAALVPEADAGLLGVGSLLTLAVVWRRRAESTCVASFDLGGQVTKAGEPYPARPVSRRRQRFDETPTTSL